MSLFWWRKWINAIKIIKNKWKIKEINLVTKWLHWGELKHDHHFLEKGAHQANKLKRDETEIWDSPLELLEQKSKLTPSLHGFMLGVCSTGALTSLAVCLCLCVCVWRFCSVSVHRAVCSLSRRIDKTQCAPCSRSRFVSHSLSLRVFLSPLWFSSFLRPHPRLILIAEYVL